MNLNLMDPRLIALVAGVLVAVALAAWLYVRKQRSTTAGLRQKFGPEYNPQCWRMDQNEKQRQN